MKNNLLMGLFVTSFLFLLGVSAANGTSLVVPQGSMVAGQDIGAWTANWWQWASSQSVPNDAFTDSTGAFANINQSGPVFFIAGTTGGSATRTFSVPDNKYLLLPLINLAISETNLGGPTSEADLRTIAASVIDSVDSLFAEIDGMTIPEFELLGHREISPVFNYTAAPNNPFGDLPGPSGNAVADGYWLMLEPLSIGTHTINFGGGISDWGFTVNVSDTISSVPEPATMLLFGTGLAGIVGAARKKKNQA